MSEIKAFVEISKYAGERLDLVQAAGGNSSVKFDNGMMLIKASGYLLSDITENSGYSRVLTSSVAAIVKNHDVVDITNKRLKESLTEQLLKTATLDNQNRPSIETLLHSILLKYTLHTHSIVVNMIVAQVQWKEILNSIFTDIEIAYVNYETPGIELAIALDKELQKLHKIPNIIILQNHGLIVTSDDKDEIKFFTEYVLKQIECYLGIDMSRYKLTNDISNLYRKIDDRLNITYLSEDIFLNEQLQVNERLFFNTPFSPDTFVYCGRSPVILNSLDDSKNLLEYKIKYNQIPKVIIYDGKLFFRASTLKRAKEIEEVFKFHIMVLFKNENKSLNFLDDEELDYLFNWEAEKFRQKMI